MGQGRDALRDHLAMGRDPVIGQAIPSRQQPSIQFGGEIVEQAGEPRHPHVVAGNMQDAPARRLPGERREDLRVDPFRRPRDRGLARCG